MIRTADFNDRIAMVRMARDFVQAADQPLPFDAAYAERSAKVWIEQDDRLALVLDLDGVCGMLCASALMSPLVPMRIALEQVFWVDPAARGGSAVRLIGAYETWARSQDCQAVTLATIQNKSAAGLYERLGYALAETHYVKVF